MAAAEEGPTLYERLGGEDALKDLVDAVYDGMVSDSSTALFFRKFPNLARLKQRTVDYFSTKWGGPQLYEGLDMYYAHQGLDIPEDAYDTMAWCYKRKLRQMHVDEAVAQEIMASVEALRIPVCDPDKKFLTEFYQKWEEAGVAKQKRREVAKGEAESKSSTTADGEGQGAELTFAQVATAGAVARKLRPSSSQGGSDAGKLRPASQNGSEASFVPSAGGDSSRPPSQNGVESSSAHGKGAGKLRPASQTGAQPSPAPAAANATPSAGAGKLRPASQTGAHPSPAPAAANATPSAGAGKFRPVSQTGAEPSPAPAAANATPGAGAGKFRPVSQTGAEPSPASAAAKGRPASPAPPPDAGAAKAQTARQQDGAPVAAAPAGAAAAGRKLRPASQTTGESANETDAATGKSRPASQNRRPRPSSQAPGASAPAPEAGAGAKPKRAPSAERSGGAAAKAKAAPPTAKESDLVRDAPDNLNLYERLGGHEALVDLVNAVYDGMVADTSTSGYFRKFPNLGRLKQRTIDYFSTKWGGPVAYEGLDMYYAHSGLDVTEDAYDFMAWCYKRKLKQMGVAKDVFDEVMASVEALKDPVCDPNKKYQAEFFEKWEEANAAKMKRRAEGQGLGASGAAAAPTAKAKVKPKAKAPVKDSPVASEDVEEATGSTFASEEKQVEEDQTTAEADDREKRRALFDFCPCTQECALVEPPPTHRAVLLSL